MKFDSILVECLIGIYFLRIFNNRSLLRLAIFDFFVLCTSC